MGTFPDLPQLGWGVQVWRAVEAINRRGAPRRFGGTEAPCSASRLWPERLGLHAGAGTGPQTEMCWRGALGRSGRGTGWKAALGPPCPPGALTLVPAGLSLGLRLMAWGQQGAPQTIVVGAVLQLHAPQPHEHPAHSHLLPGRNRLETLATGSLGPCGARRCTQHAHLPSTRTQPSPGGPVHPKAPSLVPQALGSQKRQAP